MPSYVVTGASRGLGLEFVRQLSATSGNTIVAIVRNVATADDLRKLAQERSDIHVVEGDVSNHLSMKKAAEEIAKITGGTVDVLINNAGSFARERGGYTLDTYAATGEEDLLEQDVTNQIKTDVLGVIHTTNAFLPLLQASTQTHGSAKVVVLSSALADAELTLTANLPHMGPYVIGKAAANTVVAQYAARFRDENIVFLAISPGVVNTATRPPTYEEIAGFMAMAAKLKTVYPDWNGMPLTAEESVQQMLSVIGKSEIKDSGAFVSHLGNKQWA